jgi:hypothetical protein
MINLAMIVSFFILLEPRLQFAHPARRRGLAGLADTHEHRVLIVSATDALASFHLRRLLNGETGATVVIP